MARDPKPSDRKFSATPNTAEDAQSHAGKSAEAFDKASQERIGKFISEAVTQPTKKRRRGPP